jgi:protein-S-isoprenylcysteine O-methyltransferase Ste14
MASVAEVYLRAFLPVYVAAYFFGAIVWRTFRVRRSTGVDPLAFRGETDPLRLFMGKLLSAGSVLTSLSIISFAAFGSEHPGYRWTVPIPYLGWVGFKIMGLTLLLASMAWVMVAQAQMGASWRVGIDDRGRTALVERGLYRISRNPIYVGMGATAAGMFLVMPNALTLVTVVMSWCGLKTQVYLEERFLLDAHGDAFRAYQARVRRWV